MPFLFNETVRNIFRKFQLFYFYKLEISCSQENNLITAVIISAIITANAAEPATKRAF